MHCRSGQNHDWPNSSTCIIKECGACGKEHVSRKQSLLGKQLCSMSRRWCQRDFWALHGHHLRPVLEGVPCWLLEEEGDERSFGKSLICIGGEFHHVRLLTKIRCMENVQAQCLHTKKLAPTSNQRACVWQALLFKDIAYPHHHCWIIYQHVETVRPRYSPLK